MTKPAYHNLYVTTSLAVTLLAFQPAYATENTAQDTELQTLLTQQCAGKKGLFKMKCEGEVKTAFYRIKNAELDKQNAELDKQNAEAEARVDNLKKQNAELDKQNAELDKQNAELDKQNAELDRQNAELDKQNAELDRQNAQKWQEISDRVKKKLK